MRITSDSPSQQKSVITYGRINSANFTDDLDIASPFVIGKILSGMGQVPAPIMQAAQAQESKDSFRAQADRAVALGIIGAPSFVVDGEVFWGGDRLNQALDWAAGERAGVEL